MLQVSKWSLQNLILYTFLMILYSPGARAENPFGTNFWCQQKALITLNICCKFQTNLFEFWFYKHFLMFSHKYIAPGQGQTPFMDKILMSTEKTCHFAPLLHGERGGSVVECRTPEREVRGSRPTTAVLCPWARHFTPRKYWLITQEAMAPSRYDWKIVDWDVKPQYNQPKPLCCKFQKNIFEVWFYT